AQERFQLFRQGLADLALLGAVLAPEPRGLNGDVAPLRLPDDGGSGLILHVDAGDGSKPVLLRLRRDARDLLDSRLPDHLVGLEREVRTDPVLREKAVLFERARFKALRAKAGEPQSFEFDK